MAAYRQVYDTRHLQADCQEPRSTPDPMLGYRVGATIAFFSGSCHVFRMLLLPKLAKL